MLNLSHKTVAELRREKYKVKIFHSRHVKEQDGAIKKFVPLRDIVNRSQCLAKGGSTLVTIRTPEGIEYEGHAGCVSTDPFSYKRGVSIALGRLNEVKEETNFN